MFENCPDCGYTEIKEEIKTDSFTHKGKVLSASFPVFVCPECNYMWTDYRMEDAKAQAASLFDVKEKDEIAELHERLHDLANKYQVRLATSELTVFKLRKALKDVLNFEFSAFAEAKFLLKELEDADGPSLSDQKEP